MIKNATFDWLAESRSEDMPTQLLLIERLRQGVPFRELALLIHQTGMSQEEAALALHIPLRTLARRRSTSGRLAQGEGERFVRFARILSMANDTLGSMAGAQAWMRQENRALGGATPVSLLDTDIGARAVQDVLGRIEHGIFS
jgi:putative toxin-antitoxin system antitoxin component (TIGR02293 family)